MADTIQRGVAPPQRQDVTLPNAGFSALPGINARPVSVALPGQPSPDTSAAQSLMRALDVSTGNLDALGQKIVKEDREEEFKQGQMKAQESQKAFAQAQAEGIIPQGANPWFIKGYQNQDGRVQGLDYYTAMQAAYMKDPAHASDDPAAYEKFQKDFKKQYMGKLPADRSTDWWDGFQKTSDTADQRMAAEHAANITRMVVEKQSVNTGAEVNTILNTTSDPKAAAEKINELAAKMHLEGMPDEAFAKVAAEQILAKAKLGDGRFLQVLDNVKVGDGKSGATLASDGKIAMARVSVDQFLTDKARSAQQFAWAADNHRYQVEVVRPRAEQAYQHQQETYKRQGALWDREDKTRSILSQIQAVTIARPESALAETRPLLETLNEVNPQAVTGATGFVHSYIAGTDNVPASVEAPIANQFREDIIRSAGDRRAQQEVMMRINDAISHKQLNRATFNDLFIFAERMGELDPTVSKKLYSPEVNEVKDALKRELMGDKVNPFGVLTGRANSDFLNVTDAMNNAMLEMLKKKPDATAFELRAEAKRVKDELLPSLIPNYNPSSTDELGKKAQVGADNPFPPASAPLAKGATAPPPTEMQKATAKLPLPGKVAIVREAAAAYAKGTQAFQQFLMETDRQLGVPGITAAIINEASPSQKTSP